MKGFVCIFIFFGFLSCSDDAEIKREYWSYQNQVIQTSNAYGYGLEAYYDLMEISEDRSSPDVQKVGISLFEIASIGKKQLDEIIQCIEDIKRKILSDNGIYVPKRKDEYDFLLSDITHFHKNSIISLSDYKSEIDKVSKLLRQWRSSWILNANSYYKERDFYRSRNLPIFHEPNIKHFSNLKELSAKLDLAVRDCLPDDKEAFKMFYINCSMKNPFLDNQVDFIFKDKQTILESLSILTWLEYQILMAQADMTRLIRSRIGCGGPFQFDKIMPIVNGNQIVQKGDSLSLDVFYAFYNSFGKPAVKITNLPKSSYTIRSEDGKVILKFVPKKNMIVRGTISISNKSGVIKTTTWEKEIKVVD